MFLSESPQSQDAYRGLMGVLSDVLIKEFASSSKPYSGAEPQQVAEALQHRPVCPELPEEEGDVQSLLERVGAEVLRHSAVVTHPACAAHLHCPPLMMSAAAEAWIGATNQSMDSWDQSMAGTLLEEELIGWLCGLYNLGSSADGVFTSGGTQSNLMGLLLARNHYAWSKWGWNVQKRGLPAAACRMRVLCSEAAHFTVKQSAALMGLGEQSVISIETDDRNRMRPEALERRLIELEEGGLLPFAIVATAGTTDFGSIDPLEELAAVAEQYGIWLHVDAAYGGALAMSDRHSGLLQGIGQADSMTVDFHKGFYQAISCGAFLVRDKARFQSIRLNADYLNPEEDEDEGVPNLVIKSLSTTRRFDALKLYLSLQHYGRRAFGEMVDHTVATARATAALIREENGLELIAEPELSTVVFRYVPAWCPADVEEGEWSDELNNAIRSRLMSKGWAVLARTSVNGRRCLKLTLLNPRTEKKHTAIIVRKVIETGEILARELAASIVHKGEKTGC
ncbi:aspartate aminotransferase family protein [Paenibacillus oenotherae]|uniref:Aspartate aminotransferase family protein n=2 Tax=Paenibacillus oenotherae TaxID=1435645 RepID=A0ABS7D4P7_9BACL|nr:aspartate aminotransferase family protein [Paenibacillus oenotherae]